MRPEKQTITTEYLTRLNSSPFFIVVDYQGLKVGPMTELRKRLHAAGAEIHVVKNSLFRLAARESGMGDLSLAGQLAVVTGQRDISAAAKVVKTFGSEFEKPKIRFGFLNNERLEGEQVTAIADLPTLDVLRGMLMAAINAPATQLVGVLNAPGSQLARVLQARVDKEQ
jgi:large subunit ribosomal protein L10